MKQYYEINFIKHKGGTLLYNEIRAILSNFLGISSRRLALEDAAHVLGYPFSSDIVHKVPGNYLGEAALKVRESVTVLHGISGAIKRSV